jgi:hypothetical protein
LFKKIPRLGAFCTQSVNEGLRKWRGREKTRKAIVIGKDLNPVLLVYKTDPFHSSVPFNFVGDQIKILLHLLDSLFAVCGNMALRLLDAI